MTQDRHEFREPVSTSLVAELHAWRWPRQGKGVFREVGVGQRCMSPNGGMATIFMKYLLCYTGRPTAAIYNLYCLVSSFNEWHLGGWWLVSRKGRQHLAASWSYWVSSWLPLVKNSAYTPAGRHKVRLDKPGGNRPVGKHRREMPHTSEHNCFTKSWTACADECGITDDYFPTRRCPPALWH